MADGIGYKVNADDVIAKFFRATDITQTLMPIWPKILGEDGGGGDNWALRATAKFNLENERGPQNEAWPSLKPEYKKWKDNNYSPDLPILHLTGQLYESLVNTNQYSVIAQSPLKLVYGTSLPYAGAQHYGYEPRNLPSRKYFGFRDGQKDMIELQIRKYILDAFTARGD